MTPIISISPKIGLKFYVAVITVIVIFFFIHVHFQFLKVVKVGMDTLVNNNFRVLECRDFPSAPRIDKINIIEY